MPTEAVPHRLRQILLLAASVALIGFACVRITQYVTDFSAKRDEAVTIGTRLPVLRSSVALLSANTEAQRLLGTQETASREELASAYILPAHPDSSRMVQMLQEAVLALRSQDASLQIRQLSFGAVEETTSGSVVTHEQPVHLTIAGTVPGVAQLLALLEHGGEITLHDALAQDDAAALLKLVETVAPLSLSHASEFLYTDLLRYASAADEIETRLLRDMTSDASAQVRSALIEAGLGKIRALLSPVAKHLSDARVWPLPMVRVVAVEFDGAQWKMELRQVAR